MASYGDLPSGVGTTAASPTAVAPGDNLVLFNNETVTAPQASIVLNRAMGRGDEDAGISFFIEFASSPTDSLQILGSNKLPAATFALADWIVLFTSANNQKDAYTDTQRFAYYCAYLVSQSGGGKLTVTAQR
jgi:hypothetical protein